MTVTTATPHIGTAGWAAPRAAADAFSGEGSHLQRYARVLNCSEINSGFNRSHRNEVYARWAEQTPPGFRFAVKLPRAITHDGRLRAARLPLQRFMAQVSGLGSKLAVLLVQLPHSQTFEVRSARGFFDLLADSYEGPVVCEPRHGSWFTPAADGWLVKHHIGRVAADPSREAAAGVPGGWLGPAGDGAGAVVYCRWHGAPRIYWSPYDDGWLQARAFEMRRWPATADCWGIFDNTASGAAAPNALAFAAMLRQRQTAGRDDRSGASRA